MPISRNQSLTPESSTRAVEPDPFFQTLDLAFLGSLIPGMIHNLATPLSGVLGATQLLEKRVSSLEDLLQNIQTPDQDTQAELRKQLERNRTNVEILARNAQHLADILQIIVHRVHRGGNGGRESHSLNDLLRHELKFLDANLTFKHKVKKNVTLGEDIPAEKFIYGHAAAILDEFVSQSIARHDFKQGLMEMDFATAADAESVALIMEARWVPNRVYSGAEDSLEPCITRLQAEGWHIARQDESSLSRLKITTPRLGLRT